MKVCRDCEVEKPLDEFYKGKGPGGRASYCKECHRARNRKWSEENKERHEELIAQWEDRNPEKVAASRKRWRENHPERKYIDLAKYAERHPEKKRAHRLLTQAVAKGTIEKPTICEDCGTDLEDRKLIDGHHEDYEKPYEVVWLCRQCHVDRHSEKKYAIGAV